MADTSMTEHYLTASAVNCAHKLATLMSGAEPVEDGGLRIDLDAAEAAQVLELLARWTRAGDDFLRSLQPAPELSHG